MKRTLGDTGVSVEAVTSSETTYLLDGVPPRNDLNRRTYQPGSATVVIRDGQVIQIDVAGQITKGVFRGSRTTVAYQIIDGGVTADGRVEFSPPYWLQLIADIHTTAAARTAQGIRIVWLNDDNVEVYLGNTLIVTANYDDDGSPGMDMAIKTARAFAERLGLQVAVEGSANSNA